MFGLLWLSLAVVLLGTPIDDSTFFAALRKRQTGLPLTTASNDLLCYYFQLNQNCAASAIKNLLNLSPDADVSTLNWDQSMCDDLQKGMRSLAKYVATDVFGSAITSAATASVANFELLTEIWALQVGYFALKTNPTYIAFVTSLNNIQEWKTVGCNKNALLEYDGATVAIPDFVNDYDCGILRTQIPSSCDGNCDVYDYELAETCVATQNNCVMTFYYSACDNQACSDAVRAVCALVGAPSKCSP